MSQVSMSGTMSLYMQDSEYLSIQAELDREKKRMLTEDEDAAKRKDAAASQAVLEQQLRDREAELDREQDFRLKETDKKTQQEKDAKEAREEEREKEESNGIEGKESISASPVRASENPEKGNEAANTKAESNIEDKAASEETSEEEKKQRYGMDRFEALQGHMRQLQSMNALGELFMQKISQTSSEIRTDQNEYDYQPYSKSITQKEHARGDLERRKQSVDERAGKTLKETFDTLKDDKAENKQQEANDKKDNFVVRMQNNLSGLQYAGTAFSHNVNFVF